MRGPITARRVLFWALLGSVTAAFPQVNGVPPSVTSTGPNRPLIVPPSVTSVGPRGWSGRPFVTPPPIRSRVGPPRGRTPRGQGNYLYVPFFYPYPVPYDAGPAEAPEEPAGPPPMLLAPAPPPPAEEPEEAVTPSAPAPEPAPQPTTVLVFRDGHKLEVQNYVIAGPTLYNVTDGRPRKSPISDLDVPSTVKLNEDRGVEFQLP